MKLKNLQLRLIEYGSSEWKAAVALREKILRIPLGQSFSREELKLEEQHLHIGCYMEDHLVGTAVLVPENDLQKVQRVAVEERLRNLGIGARMMYFCEETSREKGAKKIYCHARDSAVKFYSSIGYKKEGEYFPEDGIPHLKMYKEL